MERIKTAYVIKDISNDYGYAAMKVFEDVGFTTKLEEAVLFSDYEEASAYLTPAQRECVVILKVRVCSNGMVLGHYCEYKALRPFAHTLFSQAAKRVLLKNPPCVDPDVYCRPMDVPIGKLTYLKPKITDKTERGNNINVKETTNKQALSSVIGANLMLCSSLCEVKDNETGITACLTCQHKRDENKDYPCYVYRLTDKLLEVLPYLAKEFVQTGTD